MAIQYVFNPFTSNLDAVDVATPFTALVSNSSGSASPRNLSTIGAANYGAMTNNSVTLAPGTWELTTYFQMQTGTGVGVVIYNNTGIYAANGTDTATIPAALSTAGTVTGPSTFAQLGGTVIMSPAAGFGAVASFATYFVNTTTATVYAVPRTDFSTAGTANVSAYIMARKLY